MSDTALIPMRDVLLVLGTSVTLATGLGVAGLSMVRAVVAQDIKPISDNMVDLRATLKSLNDTLVQQRLDGAEQRNELHGALNGIREMLAAHQRQLGDHDVRLAVLEDSPPPAVSARIRPRRAG